MTIFYFLMAFPVVGLIYCIWRFISVCSEPRLPKYVFKSSGAVIARYSVIGDSGMTIIEETHVMEKDVSELFSTILFCCTTKMRRIMGLSDPHGYNILIRVTLGEANVGAVTVRVSAGIWPWHHPLAGLPMARVRVTTPKGEEEWLDTTLHCDNCSPAFILPVRSRPVWVKLPDGWKLHTYPQWTRLPAGTGTSIQAMTWRQALECACRTAEMTYHTRSREIHTHSTISQ